MVFKGFGGFHGKISYNMGLMGIYHLENISKSYGKIHHFVAG
jgi:hypothetical protein